MFYTPFKDDDRLYPQGNHVSASSNCIYHSGIKIATVKIQQLRQFKHHADLFFGQIQKKKNTVISPLLYFELIQNSAPLPSLFEKYKQMGYYGIGTLKNKEREKAF